MPISNCRGYIFAIQFFDMRYYLSSFLLIPLFGFSQNEIPAFIKDSLDIYVQRSLKEWRIPGCAVGIIKDGKIIMAKGYGVRDMETGSPVDENTLFMIASNSKEVTGTALAILDQEKKLSLKDRVIKWLPDFKLYDAHATSMVSIEDMVTHRIGFETFQGDFCHWSTSATSKGVMERMAKIKPVYSFRDKWGYCNAGYVVAGEIIKKASGETWEDYVSNHFFKPLQMNSTITLTANYPSTPNHCTPHTIYKNELIRLKIPNIDNLAPATSICSSVADWSKWIQMILNDGKWEDKQIIPAAAIKKTMEPVSIVGGFNPAFNTGHFSMYGLGWFIQEYNGKKVVSHGGGADGFVTSVTLLPEEKLGVIVFTNTDANNFYQALKWEIIDAYLKLPYRNYSTYSLNRFVKGKQAQTDWLKLVRDSAQNASAPELPLKAFAGNYLNEVYGKMKIVEDGKKLKATFELHPNQYSTLEHMGSNRFLCTYSNPLLGIKVFPFKIEKKKVKSVTVSCDDFVEFTTYEFVKK
jgi:CubicO group peptidase (beta-lactamase class C family)